MWLAVKLLPHLYTAYILKGYTVLSAAKAVQQSTEMPGMLIYSHR